MDHDRAVDREHLLEALGGAGQVVGGRDHRPSRRRLGLEEVHQQLLGRGVDAGHGLVEQEQVGFGGERPGEEHAPPLAAGQAPDLGPQVVVHLHLGERVADGPAIGGARAARPGPSRGNRPIITTSSTVTGNAQSTSSAWGT